uniref:ubiquitin carboxyl-terminal hydrolase MINDY-2-like n=1 Tax=Pristiophorus japonicus TaxID=55135 RepID=UPI00398ED6F5
MVRDSLACDSNYGREYGWNNQYGGRITGRTGGQEIQNARKTKRLLRTRHQSVAVLEVHKDFVKYAKPELDLHSCSVKPKRRETTKYILINSSCCPHWDITPVTASSNYSLQTAQDWGQLYLLVTDQGFLTEEKVVWESLHSVDGDGNFCDSEFHLRPPSDPETVYKGQQDQIDQDYLMALSLQQEQQSQDLSWEQIPEGISDLELAKKLQEEEDRRASQFYHEQEQAAAAQSQEGQQSQAAAAGRPHGATERKQRKEPREKEKDKCILL